MSAGANPRTRIRSARRADTRQLLIDAAIEVFRDVGYSRATIDQIAARAGASRGTYYLHFKTKSEILPELVERSGVAFVPHYGALTEAVRSGDQATMEQWILAAMDAWPLVDDLMRPVYEATAADPELHRQCFGGEEMPGVSSVVEALQAVGTIPDDQVEPSAEVMFAPLLHFFRKHLNGSSFDQALAARLIAEAWLSTIPEAPTQR